MFEFDVRVTVTQPSKGKVVPRVKTVEVKSATNILDCMSQVKSQLLKTQETLHVVLDVSCFKRNIRKERVQVTDDEVEKFEKGYIRTQPLGPMNLFERKDPWEF